MKSTLSTQKRQTFFLRKYCRLPRRPGGPPPPGPAGRPSRGAPDGPEARVVGCCSLMVLISTFSKIEYRRASRLRLVALPPSPLQELPPACAAGAARDVHDARPASAAA